MADIKLINQYVRRTLAGVVKLYRPVKTFVKDTFFTGRVYSDNEYIDIDVKINGQELSPIVNPIQEGVVVENEGFETKSFKPPYSKPKKAIKPKDFMARDPGTSLYSKVNPKALVKKVKELYEAMEQSIQRREEVMSCEALQHGKITILNKSGVAIFQIDYLMPASHKVTLVGTDKWTDYENSDPLADLREWGMVINDDTGENPDKVVLGKNVATIFINHPKVKAELDTRRVEGSSIKISKYKSGVRYLGYISGVGEIWSYAQKYTDSDGTRKSMFEENRVVYGCSESANKFGYAAIQDLEISFGDHERFAKEWYQSDPSVFWIMLQSAGLPVFSLPGTVVSAVVMDGEE